MVETLEIIRKLTIAFENLSNNQILYILGEMYNISFADCAMNPNEKEELCEAKIILNNQVVEEIKEAFTRVITYDPKDAKKIKTKGGISRFSNESKKVYDLLYTTFVGSIQESELLKYKSYMKDMTDENEAAIALYTFLSIMPTPSATKNGKWNKAFNVTYSGVTLRRLTRDTAKKFKRLYLKKDVDTGLLCLALFKFVKDGINDGKCFIKKIDHFFVEFDEWYDEAKESCFRFNKHSAVNIDAPVAGTGRRMI
jgi:hemerythrin superfamily protein